MRKCARLAVFFAVFLQAVVDSAMGSSSDSLGVTLRGFSNLPPVGTRMEVVTPKLFWLNAE